MGCGGNNQATKVAQAGLDLKIKELENKLSE